MVILLDTLWGCDVTIVTDFKGCANILMRNGESWRKSAKQIYAHQDQDREFYRSIAMCFGSE